MRRLVRVGIAAAFVLALAIPAGALSASNLANKGKPEVKPQKHNFLSKLNVREQKLRQKALEMKLEGKVPQDAKVVQVAKGQYAQLAREKTDRIFVLLVEFGNRRHEFWPDSPVSEATVFDGPLHNQIPEPDRAVDNNTLWQPNYDTAHYENMYFNRMARYYERQSSNRYSVEGAVVNWVQVPFNEARYGTDDCNADGVIDYAGGADSIVCLGNVVSLIRDGMALWVQSQLDSGKSMSDIQAYLRTFDKWDRYDINGNGNFDEPDGVIDHFQLVHSGGDQASGNECVNLPTGCDPQQGTNAIWSHRAQAVLGFNGCPFDEFGAPSLNIGIGTASTRSGPIPSNPTGVCIFDYTIQPENGGLGVFAHEYGHDLGLDDLYDTTGNTCPIPGGFCENSTGFWTLMSSGANIGDGDGPPTGKNGLGDAPVNMGALEKLQLGWLNYEVAFAGKKSEHKLGPAGSNTKQAQAVIVVLPERPRDVPIYDPLAGSSFAQWSTSGNNLDTTLTKAFALPSGGAVTADVNYITEDHWDYAFLEASPDGTAWTPVLTNLSSTDDDAGSGFNTSHTGLTGDSGGWASLTATVPAGTTQIRFRYRSDPAVVFRGFVVDNISVDGGAADTFESGDDGWTSDGFLRTGPTNSVSTPQYYFAENRNYQGDDLSLKTAYNFGFLNTIPGLVEYFPYQDGMLVTYWDTFWQDNNTTSHPGEGMILPVDAHPNVLIRGDGEPWRARVQSYDSTFGLDKTDAITLHYNGAETSHPSQAAVSVFDDSKSYWSPQTPFAGVKVPNTGTTIRVKSVAAQGSLMQIEVAPK
jgi:immune inhibitor A